MVLFGRYPVRYSVGSPPILNDDFVVLLCFFLAVGYIDVVS
jgi:hypothetical protein